MTLNCAWWLHTIRLLTFLTHIGTNWNSFCICAYLFGFSCSGYWKYEEHYRLRAPGSCYIRTRNTYFKTFNVNLNLPSSSTSDYQGDVWNILDMYYLIKCNFIFEYTQTHTNTTLFRDQAIEHCTPCSSHGKTEKVSTALITHSLTHSLTH